MQLARVSSDINSVKETAASVGKEAIMDTANALDKSGEVITDVGIALAIPTQGASLSVVPIGEGMSTLGKSMKMAIHLRNQDEKGFTKEAINIAVGSLTNRMGGALIKQSIINKTITNNSESVITKTIVGGNQSVVSKVTSLSTEKIVENEK